MTFRPVLRSLPLTSIKIIDPFWRAWIETLRDVTLPHEFAEIEKTGRLDNFLKAAGKMDGDHIGRYFNDSDVYKWLEAAAYALLLGQDAKLQELVDRATVAVANAQEPSGYLNTFFQLKHPDLKWRNLGAMHEMYCAGHLFEAGVAMFECTGDRRLLDVSIKFADHLASIFGPGKRIGSCGHEEIELALFRLAGATGNESYSSLSKWMIEMRGRRPSPFENELDDKEAMMISPWSRAMFSRDGKYTGEYLQDHAPVEEHSSVVGHAVRAMYLYIGATEAAAASGNEAISDAMVRAWDNLTNRRMYVTGGIGPSGDNEGFTTDFDLPNLTAYAETCAACGLAMWGRQLVHATGNAEYAGIVERALYNGMLSGISLSGDHFFYANPLESNGSHSRVPWFDCACCPPNVARVIGSIGAYVAGISDDAFWVHIPTGFEATVSFKGVPVKITLEGNYPWSGTFTITVEPAKPVEFELRLRIPDWSESVETELPGLGAPADYEAGYAVFKKVWSPGDMLKVELEMAPTWVQADPRVREDLGRVALTRGPLVYCAEAIDNGFAPQLFRADADAPITEDQSKLLGGVVTMTTAGDREDGTPADTLYGPATDQNSSLAELKLIPYYAWCNRGPNEMQVWFRRI
jgi:hypothetical protein